MCPQLWGPKEQKRERETERGTEIKEGEYETKSGEQEKGERNPETHSPYLSICFIHRPLSVTKGISKSKFKGSGKSFPHQYPL